MHPWLEDLTLFTFYLVFDTEEKCLTLFNDMGLIPIKDSPAPDCPSCGRSMCVQDNFDSELEWEWVCVGNSSEDNGNNLDSKVKCDVTVNPAENTLFEGKQLPFQDILVLIYFFVIRHPVDLVVSELSRATHFFDKPAISKNVVSEYYAIFREVCEVHASHFSQMLGGPGKTARISDIFLAKRKYHYDRVFGRNPILVLGLYCRLEKSQEGVFLEIDDRKKSDLLPIIYGYFHPETKLICLGMKPEILKAKNSDTFRKNHKRPRVDQVNQPVFSDEELLIEHLEQLVPSKLHISQHRMALGTYRRCRFLNKTVCEQLEIFLFDIRSVYPGPLTQGLRLKSVRDFISDQCQDNKPELNECCAQGDEKSNFDW